MLDRIHFELLHKPAGGNAPVTSELLEDKRPSADRIERCANWLRSQNISAHDTGFGLACSASLVDFERIFNVAVRIASDKRGQNALELDGNPRIPDAIVNDVESLTLSRVPDFFH